MPDMLTKSSGVVAAPRKTSSLKYMNFFDKPGILCKCDSIAGELKTGKCDLLGKISVSEVIVKEIKS